MSDRDHPHPQTAPGYGEKKAFFDRVVTVYGRKPALEALLDRRLTCHAVHLADSNRPSGIIAEILAAASARDIPVRRHSREELAHTTEEHVSVEDLIKATAVYSLIPEVLNVEK